MLSSLATTEESFAYWKNIAAKFAPADAMPKKASETLCCGIRNRLSRASLDHVKGGRLSINGHTRHISILQQKGIACRPSNAVLRDEAIVRSSV